MQAAAFGLRNTVALKSIAWALALVVAFLTLAPASFRPKTLLPHDIEHFLAFAIVGTIIGLAYPSRRRVVFVSALVIPLLELLQTFMPGRHAQTQDILANLAGFWAGLAMASLGCSLRGRLLVVPTAARTRPTDAPAVSTGIGTAGAFSGASQPVLVAGARLRTLVFLLSVLAINYTLSRPSPVDFLFFCALVLTPISRQSVNMQSVIFFFLSITWLLSIYTSSVSLLDKPEVAFQFVALTSVVVISITSCLVTAEWTERDFRRFVKVCIFAAAVAACIGIFGFATQNALLTWDDRAKAFLDDPNMFGAFLIPGILGSLYMIAEKRRKLLFGAALLLLVVALVLSFSRAAITFGMLSSGAYLLFLNRHNLLKASLAALSILLLVGAACLISYVGIDNFSEKVIERFTIAKEYDLGYGGRYHRYILALPFLLEHPLGLGLYELDKYFPEPIHNIWISSFLNYGWVAGLAWTLLMVLSLQITWYNWKRTRNSLCLFVFFSWLSIVSCAMLHQSERWRHLWLFTGIVWGFNYRNFPAASRSVAGEGRADARLRPQVVR
jgi:VanZ family protein